MQGFSTISNAFKSENVYNIVTPRKHIPYETGEFLYDDFKIFKRFTTFDYMKLKPEYDYDFEERDNNSLLRF